MTSSDSQHSTWERRIAGAFRGAPTPTDTIWREAVARSLNPPKARASRFAIELAASLAVALIVVGVIAVPRLVTRFSSPQGRTATAQPSGVSASSSPAVPACALPIAILTPTSTAANGFLRVDTGVFTAGAASAANGEAYARGLGKWVQANQLELAPDGASYAYADRSGALHLVDRQQDRRIPTGTGAIQVLGFVSEQSVAYTAPDATGQIGTWLMDTGTLQSRIVSKGRLYTWAGTGALWRLGPPAHGTGVALYRFDVGTGIDELWFDVDGYLGPEPSQSPLPLTSEGAAHSPQDSLHHSFGIIGFDDSGHPIVQLGSAGAGFLSAALLITGKGAVQTLVAPGANGPSHFVPQSAVGGDSAVWLVDPAGRVGVYRGAGPLRFIASLPVPVGGEAMVAGACT